MSDKNEEVENVEEGADHTVPADLLDLSVALDEAGITPEQFKEAYSK